MPANFWSRTLGLLGGQRLRWGQEAAHLLLYILPGRDQLGDGIPRLLEVSPGPLDCGLELLVGLDPRQFLLGSLHRRTIATQRLQRLLRLPRPGLALVAAGVGLPGLFAER